MAAVADRRYRCIKCFFHGVPVKALNTTSGRVNLEIFINMLGKESAGELQKPG
jgi:hypothetical protein